MFSFPSKQPFKYQFQFSRALQTPRVHLFLLLKDDRTDFRVFQLIGWLAFLSDQDPNLNLYRNFSETPPTNSFVISLNNFQQTQLIQTLIFFFFFITPIRFLIVCRPFRLICSPHVHQRIRLQCGELSPTSFQSNSVTLAKKVRQKNQSGYGWP